MGSKWTEDSARKPQHNGNSSFKACFLINSFAFGELCGLHCAWSVFSAVPQNKSLGCCWGCIPSLWSNYSLIIGQTVFVIQLSMCKIQTYSKLYVLFLWLEECSYHLTCFIVVWRLLYVSGSRLKVIKLKSILIWWTTQPTFLLYGIKQYSF